MMLPQLPKRKIEASTPAGSSRVQVPAFVHDLYKDMRDRRLIIPAVALLVAIVALPMLLSRSADLTVVTPPPVEDPAAVAVDPAVLAVQEAGVRDFRERLDALKRKDPFGGRFDPAPIDAAAPAALVEPEESAAGGAVKAEAGPADPARTDTSVEPVEPVEPAPSDSSAPATAPKPYVLVPRIDATVGVVDRDRRQRLENVKAGDLLPSRQVPVAMFLGNTEDSEFAELLVSRDVEAVNGEGKCKPRKTKCEYLRLADGDSAYLRFADGKRYVIKVTDIYFTRVDEAQLDARD